MDNFDWPGVRVLHIEPTTVCNATCPQCAREDPALYQDHLHRSDLTLDRVKQLVSVDRAQQLEKVFVCGDFGDPAAGKETLDILSWFRELNPNIVLGMNTNGGLRQPGWWQKLARVLSGDRDYCVFSIDGLEDTNHVYRRGIRWERVMENASAFIDSGGPAHWDMLIFEHNQHQIDQAETLAADMGFRWFRAKVSRRFNTKPVQWLRPPRGYQVPDITHREHIQCHALQEQSLYISSNGELLPCCFLGNRVFNKDARLAELLNTDRFQGIIDSWSHEPHEVCRNTCGVTDTGRSHFDQQWQRETQLW